MFVYSSQTVCAPAVCAQAVCAQAVCAQAVCAQAICGRLYARRLYAHRLYARRLYAAGCMRQAVCAPLYSVENQRLEYLLQRFYSSTSVSLSFCLSFLCSLSHSLDIPERWRDQAFHFLYDLTLSRYKLDLGGSPFLPDSLLHHSLAPLALNRCLFTLLFLYLSNQCVISN